MEERRKIERFRMRLPTRLTVINQNQNALQTETRDISSSGAFLLTAKPLHEGTQITLEFSLPAKRFRQLFNEKRSVNLRIKGMVVRKEASGLAVQFEKKYEIGSFS